MTSSELSKIFKLVCARMLNLSTVCLWGCFGAGQTGQFCTEQPPGTITFQGPGSGI